VRRQRPPAVQTAGYRLLGVSLAICGLALFVEVLHKLSGSYLGIGEMLAIILAGAMSAAFIWYGWFLTKQGDHNRK